MKKNISSINGILVILLCAIVGVETFCLVISSTKKCNTIVIDANDRQNETVKENTENSYELYAKKLKETRSAYKFSDDMTQSGDHQEESGEGYIARLLSDGSLYVELNDDLKQKYSITEKHHKLTSDILQFYVLFEGNGGLSSIFAIKENGTVTKIAFEQTIVITDNYKNLKNIVNIIQGARVGSHNPFFVDINGNLYK